MNTKQNDFPLFINIGNDTFIIRKALVDELEELRVACDFDRKLMTCRPIVNRDMEASIKLFTDLVNNKNNLLLGIYFEDTAGTHIIGRLSFYDYNSRNRSLEMGYMLHNAWQGKGIMQKCIISVTNALFEKYNINKIYAQTCEINVKSRNLLEHCGFKIDARLREHHEYNETLYDDYIYSILKSEVPCQI